LPFLKKLAYAIPAFAFAGYAAEKPQSAHRNQEQDHDLYPLFKPVLLHSGG